MRRLLFTIPILILLATAGCKSYQSASGLGNDGYSDIKLADDKYRVTYQESDYETAYKYMLRRAAELTVENGYSYFVILSESETTADHGEMPVNTLPGMSNTVHYSDNKVIATIQFTSRDSLPQGANAFKASSFLKQ